MKRLLRLLILLFCTTGTVVAQTVSGYLVDEQNISIEYANVMLLNAKDSTFISGCVTDDKGRFCIENDKQAGDLLKLSYIGYEDYYYPLKGATGEIGTIVMKSKATMLDDITVTASKPIFRQKNGTLITQVAGSVLSQTHEIKNLIAQIPGIVKTADNGIEVFGLGSPIIYINNKKILDKTELEQLSPKEIKSIELITNPGARYDAEGKAVLKIITLKREDGFTLQVNEKYEQNERPSYYSDLKMGYKHQNLSLSAGYGFFNYKSKTKQPQDQDLFIGTDTYSYINDQRAKGRQIGHDWQVNADYEVNDKHSFGAEWNASTNSDKEYRLSPFEYLNNEVLIQHTDIANDYKNKTDYNHVNLFYNGTWSERFSTALNLDYARNKNDYHQETDETTANALMETISDGNSTMDIYGGKLDFDYKLNDNVTFTGGVEYNHTNGDGTLFCTSDAMPSSNYANIENKYALYVEANAQWGNLSVSGGIRYEDLTSNYKDYTDRTADVHRHYKNIYPSFALTYNRNGWSNTWSFSSRTNRPTFRQLSNASYYANEFMYQHGNPLLKPSNSYIAQWSTGYKFLNFSASYTYMKDYITTDFYTPENNQMQIVSSFINYDKIQYIKVNLNLQKNFSWWKPSFSLGLSQPFFTAEYRGDKMSYNNPQFYLVANQYFQLPRSYMISAYYYFNSGGHQGAVHLKPFQMLNINIQKSFFNDKLSVNLQAYDIFHTMKYKETEKIKNTFFRQTEDYSLWNYSISFIYRLNQKKTKYRGKASINEEINRL